MRFLWQIQHSLLTQQLHLLFYSSCSVVQRSQDVYSSWHIVVKHKILLLLISVVSFLLLWAHQCIAKQSFFLFVRVLHSKHRLIFNLESYSRPCSDFGKVSQLLPHKRLSHWHGYKPWQILKNTRITRISPLKQHILQNSLEFSYF